MASATDDAVVSVSIAPDAADSPVFDSSLSSSTRLSLTSSPAEPATVRRRSDDIPDDSSIKKPAASHFAPALPSAFDRLPDEIIQQILLGVDSNSFASLALLNSKWHLVSQQAHLYAHHLARSPSYAASHKNFLVRLAKRRQDGHNDDTNDADDSLLQELRRDFAREVKRNRFDAYLRPSRTLIRLVSNSISSSSCPGGEGMLFQASPKGHHLLAYNSSRIYVLDLRRPVVEVRRELKILRRPAAICILDDASTLAVLLTAMQVDLYDLRQSPPRRTQSIILDHRPRAIALSPCGSVLAAAFDGGIEVSSLGPGAMDTDRRSVKCEPVDTLAFSYDGTQILGTTVHTAQPNTVILTAPYYDPGSHVAGDDMGALWTTSILFPNTSRDCGHAVLLQDSAREEAFWTFTYDRSFETFRAVRIDDLRNGTTYFTGPIPTTASQARLLPCTLPAASYHSDLVCAGFQDKDIWLYGVPEDLDAVPDQTVLENADSSSAGGASGSLTHSSSRASGSPSMRAASTRLQEPGSNSASVRVPQWQLLCDKLRNTFIAGYRIGELPGMSMIKWVEGFGDSSLRERLVVCARGVSPPKPISSEDEDMDFIDGGRLLVVDFDYSLADGSETEITIEVGDKEPEELEEERRDLDTEVAIVRRRTVAQKRGGRGTLMRSATTAAAASASIPRLSARASTTLTPSSSGGDNDGDDDDPLRPRRIGVLTDRRQDQTSARSEKDAEAAGMTSGPTARTAIPSTVAEEAAETESMLEQEAFDAPYSHASPRSGTTLRRAATAAANNRRLNPQPATTSSGAPVVYRRADGRRELPHESDADNWVPPPPPYQKEDPGDLPVFLRHNVAPISAPGQSASVAPVRPVVARPSEAVARARQTTGRPTSRPVSLLSTYSADDLYDATPRATPQPVEQSPSTTPRETANEAAVSVFNQPPAVPSLVSAASWNVTSQHQAYDQNSYVPRPLENVHTWPLRQPSVSARGDGRRGQPGAAADGGFPQVSANEQRSRRMSGAGFQMPRVPVGRVRQSRVPSVGAAAGDSRSWNVQLPAAAPEPDQRLAAPPIEDQPLIISTPQGVSGAFDPPRSSKAERQQETQILAPVARHPQAQERSAMLRERLEFMSGGGNAGQVQQQRQQAQPLPLFSPLINAGYPASTTTATRQSSLGRRLSRAERSAAKNIADAKKRGWRRKNSKKSTKGKEVVAGTAARLSGTGLSVAALLLPPQSGRTRKKKKSKRKERDFDAASSAAWTDVTAVSMADGAGSTYYQQSGQRGTMPSVPTGPNSSSAHVMQQMQTQTQMQQQQQQQYYEQQLQQGGKGKNAKCAVM